MSNAESLETQCWICAKCKDDHDRDEPCRTNRVELIFIGSHFYHESGTMMSSIYTLDGRRFDWGFVNVALRNGQEVFIRPATEKERHPYEEKLAELKARKRNVNGADGG